ncbi:hypothetical protein ACROYT_G039315 [Oculina patagonica]
MTPENVCMILDLEGYFVEKTFRVRELGYYTWQEKFGRHAFYMRMSWCNLSSRDRKTVSYVKYNVHGLTYQPRKEEKAYEYDRVEEVMWDLYEETKTPERTVVAYKGGHVERDLLNKLNIPSVNLELYGCPKYDVLKETIVEPLPRRSQKKQARKKTSKKKASKKEDKQEEDIVLDPSNMGENDSIKDIAEWSNEWNDDGDELLADSVDQSVQDEPGFDFQLFPHVDRRVRRFGLRHRNYTARLVQRGGGVDLSVPLGPRPVLAGEIEEALQRAINRQVLTDDAVRLDDHLLININSNRLRNAYHSRRLSVRDWRDNTLPARQVLDQLSNMLNSDQQFRIDDSFNLNISHIQDPGRGGRPPKVGLDAIEKILDEKKSVIKITNTDSLCCARALVTMKAHRDLGASDNRYKNIRQGSRVQERLAKELHRSAGVAEGPCGLDELQKFQVSLAEYQIVVISVQHGYQIIYKGPQRPEAKRLILIKNGDHYHGCNSLKGFFDKNFYCIECEKGYDHNNAKDHRCLGRKCFACHQSDCRDYKRAEGETAQVRCNDCGRCFFGDRCFKNHKQRQSDDGKKADGRKKNSVCHTRKKCERCRKTYEGYELTNGHRCGHAECPSCRKYVDLNAHKCTIQNPEKLEEDREKRRARKRRNDGTRIVPQEPEPPVFVSWDAEARQEEGIHVPNLICAMTTNSEEEYQFEGETCVKDFLDWLREIAEDSKVIAVAHNFQGYDAYFVLDELYRQGICPDQVVNGAKILSMSIPNITFKDSMCFLQMPLSSFPKSFGLTEEKKGFFPHFFNTVNNQSYVGRIPARDYYDPQGMSKERKEEFDQWYAERLAENYHFDFQKELIAYCKSDVRLLHEGCRVFREEFRDVAGFDPMEKCLTIATACNLYFRTKCMRKDTLGSEPVRGWHGKGKPHSRASMEWLLYVGNVTHARNGGEAVIPVAGKRVHVDGLSTDEKTVYEFHGCFYHGCPTCFPQRDKKHSKLDGRSMRDAYESTLDKTASLREAGYEVIEMWECEWNEKKRTDADVGAYVKSLRLTERLEPRDAFFGGRTNAIKLYHKVQEGEKIQYVDFTSLYPFINKNCEYPVGHPEIIVEPGTTDLSGYFGLAKCTVSPPHGLYHPVLPYRHGGKLTFPLCRTCVETEQGKPLTERSCKCKHSPEERQLTGTWCTPEIEEAVKRGYVIEHVHEVWHFEKKDDTLFREFVNTFLKMKQEASGWPSWVGDDVDKRVQYITQYEQKEGIKLDADKIEKNPGRRSLAKMMLNSFWGKYGQQSNKSQVEAYTSPAEFHDLLRNDEKVIEDLRVVNPEMTEVVHKNKEACDPVQVNINIFVACFTTCWARLKLYRDGLSKLQDEQVLYFDTDSIIYKRGEGEDELPLGDYLGEFTNELDDEDFIVEFASAGPKNYGYKTKNGKTTCKVRGFSLNARGSEQLNYEILKQNVCDEVERPLDKPRHIPVFNPHKITRDKKTKQLHTQTEIKQYRVVFDKRVVDPDSFFSYPYGYLKSRLEVEAEELMDLAELNEQDKRNIEVLMDL